MTMQGIQIEIYNDRLFEKIHQEEFRGTVKNNNL